MSDNGDNAPARGATCGVEVPKKEEELGFFCLMFVIPITNMERLTLVCTDGETRPLVSEACSS